MSDPAGARDVVPRGARSVVLVVAAALVALEALAIAVYGVLAVGAGPSSAYPTTAYGVGGTAILVAVLLGATAIALVRARPWSRTAAIVWQLVQVLVGVYAFTGDGPQPLFGFAAIVPAVAVLALLLTRAAREATERAPR